MKRADSIGSIVGSVIASLSGEKAGHAAKISHVWEKAAGKKTARFCRPAGFKNGRLTVNVAGSSWMYELNLKKDSLRQALNKKLKRSGTQVKEIALRIGEV